MSVQTENWLWAASLLERAETVALDQDLDVDLAVIGGGFTGCSAALEAARSGASVAVLEAKQIGSGGSGRNAGLVNAGLWMPPEDIVAQMGETAGRRLIDALGNSPDAVYGLVKREGINCEAVQAGTLHLAHAESGVEDLKNRHRQGNAFGAALQLLDANETQARTGSDAYLGALLNPRAGTIQPLAYCHGLARAAQRAGAELYTDTPVQRLRRDGDIWVVETPGGTVRAKALLQGTNAYAEGALRPKAPQFIPVYYCQFATVPAPKEVLDQVLPGQEGTWDTALIMSSYRRDAAGRIIIGGMGNATHIGGGLHAGWARRKLAQFSPLLADLPFEHSWTGRIAMTSDHVPKILSLGPRGLSIVGYSGRGIGPGTVFGTAAAKALLTEDYSLLPLDVTETYAESFAGLRGAYYEFGATAVHALSARIIR